MAEDLVGNDGARVARLDGATEPGTAAGLGLGLRSSPPPCLVVLLLHGLAIRSLALLWLALSEETRHDRYEGRRDLEEGKNACGCGHGRYLVL